MFAFNVNNNANVCFYSCLKNLFKTLNSFFFNLKVFRGHGDIIIPENFQGEIVFSNFQQDGLISKKNQESEIEIAGFFARNWMINVSMHFFNNF